MKNYTKTIVSAIQNWTTDKIKNSVPDWNQNDPNGINYVKNRTHYEEMRIVNVEELLYTLDNFTINNASPVGEDAVFYSHNCDIPLQLGQTWFVDIGSLDGEVEVQQANDGTLYIGSYPSAVGTYPWCITPTGIWIADTWEDFENFLTSWTVNGVSGSAITPIIHQLDLKYLPIATDEDIMNMLAEIGSITPVTSRDDSIYISANGEIYIL